MLIREHKRKWDFDAIIDYFENKLNDKENAQIDELIQSDEDFANWVNDLYAGWVKEPETYRNEVKSVQEHLFNNLEQLAKASKATTVEKNIRAQPTLLESIYSLLKQPAIRYSALAASLALVFWLFYMQLGGQQCPLADYQCHLNEFGIFQADIHMSGTQNKAYKALETYQSGNYEQSIQENLPLLNSNELSVKLRNELQLCMGIARLKTGNPQAAEPHFEWLITMGDNRYKEEGKWYKTLLLLHNNKAAEAKKNTTGTGSRQWRSSR